MAEIFNNNLQEFLGNLVKDEQASFFTRDTLKDLTYKDESEYQDSQAYKDLKHKESNNYFADLLEVVLLKAHQFRKETLLREATLKEEMDFQGEYALIYTQAEYETNSLTQIQSINGKEGEGFFKNLVSKFLIGSLLTNVIKILIVTPVKFVFKQALNFSSLVLKTFLRTGVGQYVSKVFTLARQVLVRYTRVAAVCKFFIQSALTVGRYILTNPYALAALGILTLAGGGYLWYRSGEEKEGAPYEEIKEEVPTKKRVFKPTEPAESSPIQKEKVSKKPQTYAPSTDGEGPKTLQEAVRRYDKPSPEILAAMKKAAQVTNVPLDWFIKIAWVESRFNPKARPWSSKQRRFLSFAGGLYQFIDSTWISMLKKYGEKYGVPITASRYDPYYSSIIAGAMWKGEKQENVIDTYIAHNLGSAGLRKYKRALALYPNTPAPNALSRLGLSSRAWQNNPQFYFVGNKPLTMKESYAKYAETLNEGTKVLAMVNETPNTVFQIIEKPVVKEKEKNNTILAFNSFKKPIPQMSEPVMYNGILVN